jgi:hypothetical protein
MKRKNLKRCHQKHACECVILAGMNENLKTVDLLGTTISTLYTWEI